MKKDEIRIGGLYLAKVTNKVVGIRIDAENRHGGWDATNLETNKKLRIKSAQRLRGPAPDAHPRARAVAEAQADDASAHADVVPLNQAMKPAQGKRDTDGRKPKKLSGLCIAYEILKDAGEPMNCPDLVKKMIGEGLWKTDGKTPAATIYSAILREIQTKGDAARFKKTDRGRFIANA